MRKFLIGFISLSAVLAVYLLYNRLSKVPAIDTGPAAEFIDSAADSNMVGLDGEVGRVGDVGIGPVRRARYITRDKNKRVVREFGFEKLLHEVGDIFEVEKPYMNEYQRNFNCYITADRGNVQVESAVGRTTLKDATFTSNVVVHILPEGSGSFKESFVYLDDIIFLSERSQLSSAGPVRFASEDAQMRGKGFQLIYDDQTGRLEFFRIINLESLRIKSSQAVFFSTGKKEAERPGEGDSHPEAQQPEKPAIDGDIRQVEALPTVTQPQVEQQGEYYKCVLSKNVFIDAPEQLVFAGDKVFINDIFWSKASSSQSGEVDSGGTDDTRTIAATAEQGRQSADKAGEYNLTASKPSEPNESSQQFVDIVVTCDNGVVIVPMDSTRAIDNFIGTGIKTDSSDKELPAKLNDDTVRTKFLAQRIDYNAATGDVIAYGFPNLTFYTGDVTGTEANEAPVPIRIAARRTARYLKASNRAIFTGDCLCTMPQSGFTEQRDVTFRAPEITINLPEDTSRQPDIFATGPAQLTFYVEDSNDTDATKEPIPVTVNAQKQASFLAASNQIVFEGDCRCTMLQEDPNVLEKYVLLSEQIKIDLAQDANDRSSELAAGITHLTAGGGVVTLATTKTAKAERALAKEVQDANSEKLLGGVELKCQKFDYDAAEQTFIATGPGLIKLFNSGGSEPNEQMGRFSLRKPGWAVLRDFDTLKYFLKENRIVADAGSKKLLIDYFSMVNGQHDEHVTAEASHVEAILYEAAEGQTELSSLTATGGIEYEDKRRNHFIGSELFYDHEKSIVQVKGDKSQPCYYNGALVDEIKYDLKTGIVEAKVVGPGALQTKP